MVAPRSLRQTLTAALLSIVSVHGLRSRSSESVKDDWLQYVLVQRYPNAQILSFHYQLDLSPPSGIPNSWHHTIERGSELLYALVHREDFNTRRRPLLLICRGFGGLVVKEV